MRLKSIITVGVLTAAVGAMPVLAGCGGSDSSSTSTSSSSSSTSTSSVAKEDLVAKFQEAAAATSWSINSTTTQDMTTNGEQVVTTTEGVTQGIASTGAFLSDTKMTTKSSVGDQVNQTTVYGVPAGDDSYSVYTGAPNESGQQAWSVQTLDKATYDATYKNFITNQLAAYTTVLDKLSVGSEETLNGTSCYTLTGSITASDFASLGSSGQSAQAASDANIGLTVYFKADTKEFYGMKYDTKAMTEQTLAAQGSSGTVNASDSTMIYSLNSVSSIEVPENIVSAMSE